MSERRERKEPKGDKLEFDGVVQEALPNAMFRVKCDNGLVVLATISGGCAVLHSHPPGRPRDGRSEPLRPEPRAHHLPPQVSTGSRTARSPEQEIAHEGPSERQENLRQVQGGPPQGRRPHHLREPPSQAAPRLSEAEHHGPHRRRRPPPSQAHRLRAPVPLRDRASRSRAEICAKTGIAPNKIRPRSSPNRRSRRSASCSRPNTRSRAISAARCR
jgi:hypothetical protein